MIWAEIFWSAVGALFSGAIIRSALEAALVAQLAILSLFLFARVRGRAAGGLYLLLITTGLLYEIAANALAGMGILPQLRQANYFIDLALAPALLSFAATVGMPTSNRAAFAWLQFWVVPAGALLLASGLHEGPDIFLCAEHLVYLCAALTIAQRRWSQLRRVHRQLLILLLGGFALMLALRIAIIIDAGRLAGYRASPGYGVILLVALSLSSALLWTALSQLPGATWLSVVPIRSAAETDSIETELVRLMEDERLYLRPNLSLADVASKLSVSSREISAIVTSRFGENFSRYVNRKRVNAAAEALAHSRRPITTIMYDCGFGSKSAFQREFRRQFGVNPSEYRRTEPNGG